MSLYTVGTIVNTHGIRGEVKVMPNSDFIEKRFAKGSKLLIDGNEVTVKSMRVQKNLLLVSFEEFDNINQVEGFKGQDIQVDGHHADDELAEDEFYYDQLIGLEVFDQDDQLVGTLQDIIELPSNDVWTVISPDKKEYLIPYVSDIVKSVDLENKKIAIEVVEGLLE